MHKVRDRFVNHLGGTAKPGRGDPGLYDLSGSNGKPSTETPALSPLLSAGRVKYRPAEGIRPSRLCTSVSNAARSASNKRSRARPSRSSLKLFKFPPATPKRPV